MVDIEGDYDIAAPCALVWEMVQDPEILSRILPGCEKLELTGENEYQGKIRIQVGPVDGMFQGKLELSDVRPLEGFHMLVNGRGPSGVIRGEGDLNLHPTETGTRLIYEGTGEVSGRMASVGQRLMTSSAKAVTKQCLQNLDRQVQARQAPPETEVSGINGRAAAERAMPQGAPPAPSQTEFMLGVGEELLAEYIPDPRQRKLVGGLVLAVLIFAFLNWYAGLVARKVAKQMQKE
jgi:uncharacterized protein